MSPASRWPGAFSLWIFPVEHFDQAESARRGGGTGQPPVFHFQKLFHMFRRHLVAANFDQRTDDIADHVFQKSIAFDGDPYKIPLFGDGYFKNFPMVLPSSYLFRPLVGKGDLLRR